MGKKHDELMAEIKLVHQEIFDLRCEIDQLRNMIPPVIPIYSPQYSIPATPQCPVWSDSSTAKDKV